MELYRVYDERGGYVETSEKPEGVEYEIIEFELPDTKDAEIEALREQTRKEISALIFEHTQRQSMRGIQIPEDILQQYDEMRAEYQIKKQEILNR